MKGSPSLWAWSVGQKKALPALHTARNYAFLISASPFLQLLLGSPTPHPLLPLVPSPNPPIPSYNNSVCEKIDQHAHNKPMLPKTHRVSQYSPWGCCLLTTRSTTAVVHTPLPPPPPPTPPQLPQLLQPQVDHQGLLTHKVGQSSQ